MRTSLIYIICWILIIVLSISNVHSQQNANYSFFHITPAQGLSHYRAWSIYQDSQGFYWISTTDGLNRYDGNTFHAFFHDKNNAQTIAANVIKAVDENSKGDIIVGTSDGVSIQKFGSLTFTTVFKPPTVNALLGKEEISGFLCDKRDHIWINTRNFLIELDEKYKLLRTYSMSEFGGNVIYKMLEDRHGNIWINCSGKLNKIEVNTCNRIVHHANSLPYFLKMPVADFCFGAAGELIVIENQRHEIHQFSNDGRRLHTWRLDASKSMEMVRCFYTSSKGIWIKTLLDGLYNLDTQTGAVASFYHDSGNPNSICSNEIAEVNEDRFGNIWFCTDGGLDYLPHSELTVESFVHFGFIDKEKKFPVSITQLLCNKQYAWLSVWGNGICRIDRRNGKQTYFTNGKTDNDTYCNALSFGDKGIYVGNYSGLYLFDTLRCTYSELNQYKGYPSAEKNLPVHLLYTDSSRNLWISLTEDRGILFLDAQKKKFIRYSSHAPDAFYPFRNASAFAQLNNSTLLAGYNRSSGVLWFNSSTNRFEKYQPLLQLGFDEPVQCLFVACDEIWIGNNNGISIANLKKNTLEKLTRQNGLPGNNITAITGLGGYIWVGTNNGISRIEINTRHISNFSQHDGLPENNIVSLCYNPLTRLIEGTCVYSAFAFNPKIEPKFQNERPLIHTVNVEGKLISGLSCTLLELPENYLDLHMVFAYPVNPARPGVYYQYRMLPGSGKWIDAGRTNEINFSNLAVGRYKFELRASSDGMHWKNAKNTITIQVIPPFYRRTWFIVSVIAFILVLLMVLLHFRYRLKLKQIQHAQQIRDRIARDLHDDVGSTLGTISIMSEVAFTRVKKNPEEAENYLQKIGENARHLIMKMNDIIWSINSDKDSMKSLVERMNDYAQQLNSENTVQYRLEVDEQIYNVKIPMEHRKNIYLICKEALHNSFKHSACKTIFVQIALLESEVIYLSIEDDGKGFDAALLVNGNGLRNMHRRAGDLSADLNVQTAHNKGTRLTLKYKI